MENGHSFTSASQTVPIFALLSLIKCRQLLAPPVSSKPFNITPLISRHINIFIIFLEKVHGKIFRPIFISVDPVRDTPSRIQRYLEDFHPSFIGLVGSWDAIKAVCKEYRVYFSTPPNAKPIDDYLVDHSIFVYLMDPNGEFVEAFGQSVSAGEVAAKIKEVIGEWEENHGRKS